MMQGRQIQGLSALGLTTLVLIACSVWVPEPLAAATRWVLVWAGLEGLLGFYGLTWGLSKSNKSFYSIFAWGSLLRLLSIGITAWLLVSFRIPPTVPLISLVFAYFVLS